MVDLIKKGLPKRLAALFIISSFEVRHKPELHPKPTSLLQTLVQASDL